MRLCGRLTVSPVPDRWFPVRGFCSGGRPERPRHAAAVRAGHQRRSDRLRLRRRPVDLRPRRRQRPAPDVGPRPRVEPRVLARRQVDRLLRPVRGKHRRLRRRRRGRRAEAPDLASRATTSSTASRRTASRCSSRSPRAVFTGRYTQFFTVPVDGGRRAGAPDPAGQPRRLLARRQAHRLQPGRAAVSPVEALPRRHRLAALALRRRDARRSRRFRSPRRAPTTPARCGSATRSTSAPTATASSTSTPTTRNRRPSAA